MKKLLFLLLFIPTLSYSQITFEDIMSINSEKTFKRVMIENNYEFDQFNEEYIDYGLNIVRDSINGNKSTEWIRYKKSNGEFYFHFFIITTNMYGSKIGLDNQTYGIITNDIKKNCEYYDIINRKGMDYVCYSCSEWELWDGKIGFVISEGSGYIRHIMPTEE